VEGEKANDALRVARAPAVARPVAVHQFLRRELHVCTLALGDGGVKRHFVIQALSVCRGSLSWQSVVASAGLLLNFLAAAITPDPHHDVLPCFLLALLASIAE
jgi:hypothetical protein